MDRKNEKAIVTLGDEELSTVAGAGMPTMFGMPTMPAMPGLNIDIDISPKFATVVQTNVATNILFGEGSLLNAQSNAAVVTQ
ncbi:MAG: hypothetical protein A2V77_24930 [Anaeromyxobacter sp. RBG_16_69_14]|nr:MAG: hypothetical protein A2V77_24930 [Anaeromyxobacter sp. RBG_16_69_14]